MGMHDNSKFVFSETFMNTTGKRSGSGFIGVILGMIGGIAIIALMVGYFLEIPNTLEMTGKILELIAASTILLGVRKIAGGVASKNSNNGNNSDNTIEKG
jgi:hypothetical protein